MSKQSKTRIRLSPEARRNQLLDVSKEMIIADGLQSFSMEALARNAGVTSPLVYRYFESRVAALRELLRREYDAFSKRLNEEVAGAESIEAMVRVNIVSNFDHYAPGNIIPILESQPEIAIAIRDEVAVNRRRFARFLVQTTANNYNLDSRQAELVVRMSSGASIAAAEYASLGRMSRTKALEAALSYIIAGLEQAASKNS